jgi:hypothetical protein
MLSFSWQQCTVHNLFAWCCLEHWLHTSARIYCFLIPRHPTTTAITTLTATCSCHCHSFLLLYVCNIFACLIQQVEELLGRAQCCCQAFAGLVQLTKKHPSRTGLLSSALKVGGQFVDVLLKGLAFWRALYAGGQEQAFRALVKEVQKGTKQLQVRAAGCINLLPLLYTASSPGN